MSETIGGCSRCPIDMQMQLWRGRCERGMGLRALLYLRHALWLRRVPAPLRIEGDPKKARVQFNFAILPMFKTQVDVHAQGWPRQHVSTFKAVVAHFSGTCAWRASSTVAKAGGRCRLWTFRHRHRRVECLAPPPSWMTTSMLGHWWTAWTTMWWATHGGLAQG